MTRQEFEQKIHKMGLSIKIDEINFWEWIEVEGVGRVWLSETPYCDAVEFLPKGWAAAGNVIDPKTLVWVVSERDYSEASCKHSYWKSEGQALDQAYNKIKEFLTKKQAL